MKGVILLRHGSALSETQDPRRPLSDAGVIEVRRTGRFLRECGVTPAHIWYSTKLRAAQTADLVLEETGWDLEPEERGHLVPGGDVEETAVELEVVDGTILVAGHLPHLGKLAGRLLTGRPVTFMNIPPAGCLYLLRSEEGNWFLEWMVHPGILP